MKKNVLFFVFFLFSTLNTISQNKTIDSLKNIIKESNGKPNPKIYYFIGRIYNNTGNYKESLKYLNKISDYNKDSLSIPVLLGTNEELANVYLNLKNNGKALFHINISDSIFEAYKNKPIAKDLNHPYNLKSIILRRLGEYTKSIEYGLKSLDISLKNKKYALCAASYNSIGVLQEKLNNLEKAEVYYKKGIKILKKDTLYGQDVHNNFNGNLYMNLANSLQSQDKISQALENYKKSISYFVILKNIHRLSYIYNNIGTLKTHLKQYDSAIYYSKKSLTIKKNTSSSKDLITNYQVLSESYRNLEQYKIALHYAEKEIEIINKNQQIDVQNKMYSLLDISNTLEKNKKIKTALQYLKKYSKLKDSVLNIEKSKEIEKLETKYQTKQKETEILKLSNQNNKQKAQLAQSRLINISGALVLLLLSGLGLFFWHKRKQQQKLAILESTVKTSEEEKQRIGKELHDGIAGSIMKLVYETEGTQLNISTKLLKTYNEVRNLSHQLDNTTMHNELFIDRVLELVPDKFKDKIFTISINPSHLKLEEPYGTHFYRIIQELITNNLKHAKATKTSFKLTQKKDKIVFTYKDDGVGIKKLKKGGGFKNIEDRVELMHGKLNFKLENEKGVELSFLIPYKKDK